MNMDKRYCQNRQRRKRKRTIVPTPPNKSVNLSPSEEERHFKLRRFVEDVGKFLSEKEQCQDQESITKIKKKPATTVRKVTLPDSMINRSLLQRGGIQTKFCKRGAITREMTKKLDENLHKIISLANVNQTSQSCQCTQHCKRGVERETGLGSLECGTESQSMSILGPLQPRSPTIENLHNSPKPSASAAGGLSVATSSSTGTRITKSLSELDKELYPLFARVVSVSCTKTKSKLFKNTIKCLIGLFHETETVPGYVSAVKRKLVKMYLNGLNKDNEESSCVELPVKKTSSIATSPFPSPVTTHSSQQSKEPSFKFAPVEVSGPTTKFLQFLEETIGPSSTSSRQVFLSPVVNQTKLRHRRETECDAPNLRCRQYRHTTTSLLSPSVVGYQRPPRVSPQVPKTSRYMHEPFLPSSPTSTPLNFKSRVFDGRGDEFNFRHINSFLPPIEEEEESPDFRFFP